MNEYLSFYRMTPGGEDWRLKIHQDQTFEYMKLKIAAEWQHPNRGTQTERMYKLLKEIATSVCRPEQRVELVKLADLEEDEEEGEDE